MLRKDLPVIEKRLQSLEAHLQQENPVLLSVVQGFRQLDKVAYRMGLLEHTESFAVMIPWWPLISILGTFSAGKSSFINYYLDFPLQSSGNQAVDDKFTVICHSREPQVNVLPGLALDADPRFPFYQISEEIDKVSAGEGRRIDAYLQLKTCPSEQLLGKILIDSPGFDADQQRTSTLRLTQHIIDLSDLVLVFFDARHPEPGAMQDTLSHLVERVMLRADSNKFLYILNQIDTAAREDNPEEVFGAWQRALAQKGLTAGRFYTIYNPKVAIPIEDPARRARFEAKRDTDLAEIRRRIHQVEVERAYRIVGALEKTARDFEERWVPLLTEAIQRWRKLVLILDGALFGTLFVAFAAWSIQAGWWQGISFVAPWYQGMMQDPIWLLVGLMALLGVSGYLHLLLRKLAAGRVTHWIAQKARDGIERAGLVRAFQRNTGALHSIFSKRPAGWGRRAKKRVTAMVAETDHFVQMLNDRFANPSGRSGEASAKGATPSKPESGSVETAEQQGSDTFAR